MTPDYRAFVGPAAGYDTLAAIQFNLLTALGLRDNHQVLDIGCGSLRVGRLLIPYLLSDRYCGLEPEEWLIREGIAHEIGADLVRIKRPQFACNAHFDLSPFATTFDFVLAQSIFSHASASQIRACLRAVAACLKPSGVMAATFVVGPDDHSGEEWTYPACVHYTEAGLRRIVESLGLRMRVIDWPHPEQTWFLLAHAGSTHRLRDPVSALLKQDLSTVRVDEFLDGVPGWGYVDERRAEGDQVTIRGWARNPETNQPNKDILITTADHHLVAATIAWIPRPDVAEHFREPTLTPCGFVARFPRACLPAGHHRLHVYAFDPPTRRALLLASDPTLPDLVLSRDRLAS